MYDAPLLRVGPTVHQDFPIIKYAWDRFAQSLVSQPDIPILPSTCKKVWLAWMDLT